MITISLIWINVVISRFILVGESEPWGMMASLSLSLSRSLSLSLDLSHSQREGCGCASFSSSMRLYLHPIFHILTFTKWPSPFTFLGCLSIMSAALRIHGCCHAILIRLQMGSRRFGYRIFGIKQKKFHWLDLKQSLYRLKRFLAKRKIVREVWG